MSDLCEDCGMYMKAHPPAGGCPTRWRQNTLIMGLPDHLQPALKSRASQPPEPDKKKDGDDVVFMVMSREKAAYILELAGMEEEAHQVRSQIFAQRSN